MSHGPTTMRTGCKLNLYLRITGRREDGYHELKTLFYPLPEPHDEVVVRPGASGSGLKLTCSRLDLESEDNTIAKAYEAFARQTGRRPDISVHLEKRVPDGAGLGGGSANAAAMLRYLNLSSGAPIRPEDVVKLAATLGADVPYFLTEGPAWASGIGEKLEPAFVDLEGHSILLVCPELTISSGWAYNLWDEIRQHGADGNMADTHPDAELTSHADTAKKPSFAGAPLYNSFESVVYPAYPELQEIRDTLLDAGAVGALMSGSGSSIFGLFTDKNALETARARVSSDQTRTYVHHV